MSDALKIDDPKKCGIGEGEKCCAFLTMGAGFECGRTTSVYGTLLNRVILGSMSAKYAPSVEFPLCQEERPR